MSSSSNQSPTGSAASRVDSKNPLAALIDGGISPKDLLSHISPFFLVPPGTDDMMLWRLLATMIEPPRRKKLPQYNTIDDAIELIKKSQKIIVLSGAGISTSAGLPDFRSRNGIYVQIHEEHPDLHDPKCMFDIDYFKKNPLPFYQFAKALFPGQFKPTIGHQFIKCIEDHSKLLRNYSQNIDTLEKQAGIKRVVECHGSFARATCTSCKYSVDGDNIKNDIFDQKIPLCLLCHKVNERPVDGLGIMKPNIVFFGEQLGEEFHSSLDLDKEQVDLLIVIGSSLKVRPVALIPRSVPENVPQILINKEPLDHMSFDIELIGDCDEIIQEICLRLGGDWTSICASDKKPLNQLSGISNIEIIASSHDSNDSHKTIISKETDEDASMSSAQEGAIARDVSSSFESNEANIIASESCGPNVEGTDANEAGVKDQSAIPDCDRNSDDDWEDVEVLESSSESSEVNCQEKLDIKLPQLSFVHLAPNRYIFPGAELTKHQLENQTKDPQSSSSSHPIGKARRLARIDE